MSPASEGPSVDTAARGPAGMGVGNVDAAVKGPAEVYPEGGNLGVSVPGGP